MGKIEVAPLMEEGSELRAMMMGQPMVRKAEGEAVVVEAERPQEPLVNPSSKTGKPGREESARRR